MIKFGKKKAVNSDTDKDKNKKTAVKHDEHKIEIINVNKTYDMGRESLHVLKNINFTVDEGEFVAILGPSGSGKSTLMNVIGCMDLFDEGEYYLDRLAIHAMKEKKLTGIRNEKIGFIFQNYHLIPTYTVIQNVIMPLLMRGYEHEEAEEMCMDTIEMLGLKERVNHKPNELTGGLKQRVAIARALAKNPKRLLCDEPTGALDYNTGKQILKLLQDTCRERGVTVVVITHNLALTAMGDKVIKVKNGVVDSVTVNENPLPIEQIEW